MGLPRTDDCLARCPYPDRRWALTLPAETGANNKTHPGGGVQPGGECGGAVGCCDRYLVLDRLRVGGFAAVDPLYCETPSVGARSYAGNNGSPAYVQRPPFSVEYQVAVRVRLLVDRRDQRSAVLLLNGPGSFPPANGPRSAAETVAAFAGCPTAFEGDFRGYRAGAWVCENFGPGGGTFASVTSHEEQWCDEPQCRYPDSLTLSPVELTPAPRMEAGRNLLDGASIVGGGCFTLAAGEGPTRRFEAQANYRWYCCCHPGVPRELKVAGGCGATAGVPNLPVAGVPHRPGVWDGDFDACTADPDGPTTRDGWWALRDSGGDWAFACGHPRVPAWWKEKHCGGGAA